jgi:hypothetical protein
LTCYRCAGPWRSIAGAHSSLASTNVTQVNLRLILGKAAPDLFATIGKSAVTADEADGETAAMKDLGE